MDEKNDGSESGVPGKDGIERHIRRAYGCLKDGEAEDALAYLQEAFRLDFENEEVLYALKCLTWWMDKIKRLDDFGDLYEKGEFILSLLKSYNVFLERIEKAVSFDADNCQYAIKRFAYTKAKAHFTELLKDRPNQQDPELLLKTGRCCKGAGDWEDSREYLEQASRLRKDDSGVLSELADVNALLGSSRAAKVLFREAFFLDPQKVDLAGLESEMIVGLRDRVSCISGKGPLLAEWIPVWGRVWGVFSIRRELKPAELGRLKQSILALENELRSQSSGLASENNPALKPRLLNRYFWLLDHCEHNRDTSGLMDETLLKIKFIDPVVFEQYKS